MICIPVSRFHCIGERRNLLYNPPLLNGELKVNKRVVGVERTCSELKFQTLWAMMTSHTGRDQRNRRQVADVWDWCQDSQQSRKYDPTICRQQHLHAGWSARRA